MCDIMINRFCNVIEHYNDFYAVAEWYFIAMSRRKGPSDGLGGAMKKYYQLVQISNDRLKIKSKRRLDYFE